MTKSKKTFFKSLFCAIATLGLIPSVCGIKAKSTEVKADPAMVPTVSFLVNTTYGQLPGATTEETIDSVYFYCSCVDSESNPYTEAFVAGTYTATVVIGVNQVDYNLSSATITVNGSDNYTLGTQQAGGISLTYTFTVEAPVAISTLLPSNFPDFTGGPWTNEIKGGQAYTFNGDLKFVNGSSNTSVSLSSYAVKTGDNYIHESEGDCKLKFVMESGKLTSIEFTDLSSENPTLGGSYSLSIGTILPYDLPKDCDPEDGWSAGVDKYCYISTYLTGFYVTFDNNDGYILRAVSTKKHPTLSGGNYVYTESTKTITFNMVNGVLSSITYVDTNYDIFDGTYVSNQALVTFVAGEHGTVDLSSLRTSLETTYSMTDGVLTIGEKTVTATPEEGYVFDKWTIDGQKVTSGTVSADVTITAAFKKQNSGAKFFLKIFYIYGFTLSVKDDQSILDWVFALENLGNGKVIFDFTINDIIDGIGDLIDDVKDLIVDVQEFAEKLSYEIDDLFVSFLDDASPYASVAAFALGGVYFGGLLMSTVASFIF